MAMAEDTQPVLVTVRLANHRRARSDDGTTALCYLAAGEWGAACERLLAMLEDDLAVTVRFAGHGSDRAEPVANDLSVASSDWYVVIAEAYSGEIDGIEERLRRLVGDERLGPAWVLVADGRRNPVVAELPRLG